jgi:hypothetical protein
MVWMSVCCSVLGRSWQSQAHTIGMCTLQGESGGDNPAPRTTVGTSHTAGFQLAGIASGVHLRSWLHMTLRQHTRTFQ